MGPGGAGQERQGQIKGAGAVGERQADKTFVLLFLCLCVFSINMFSSNLTQFDNLVVI